MGNGSIIIQNKNRYVIDILDGEGNVYHQIIFNLDDVNLTGKVVEFYNNAMSTIESIQKDQNEYKDKLIKSGITEIDDITNIVKDNVVSLPEEVKNFYEVQIDGFNKLRELLDDFLGKGTCQSIFGDVNSYSMFTSFIEGLIPEFEKMGVKLSNMKKQLHKKYSVDNGKVLK